MTLRSCSCSPMLRLLLPNFLATPVVELGAGDWLNLFPASRLEPGSHEKGMPGARSFSRRTQAQYARSFSTSKKELPRCLPNFNISKGGGRQAGDGQRVSRRGGCGKGRDLCARQGRGKTRACGTAAPATSKPKCLVVTQRLGAISRVAPFPEEFRPGRWVWAGTQAPGAPPAGPSGCRTASGSPSRWSR